MCAFIWVCMGSRAGLREPRATGCLQVVKGERNDGKSLVKGANSPLKAVILTLMEIVFGRGSEKTERRQEDGGGGGKEI